MGCNDSKSVEVNNNSIQPSNVPANRLTTVKEEEDLN